MATISRTPLWKPIDIEETPIFQFIDYVNKKRGIRLKSFHDLHSWSVDASTLESFWEDAYAFLDLAPPHNKHVGRALQERITSDTRMFPPPRFFPTTTLNAAEHLLRNGKDNATAIQFIREGRPGIEVVTWSSLRSRVRAMRDAMLSHGVQKNDVIAAVISNSVDAMVICLAALSIGAMWTSASCDLGVAAVVERFGQVKPRIVFADDGYVYGGKTIGLRGRIEEWAGRLEEMEGVGLESVVVVPYCGIGGDVGRIKRGKMLGEFLGSGTGRPLEFEYLPFDHSSFILYSSGTTGPPKCIVHSAGGVLLKVKTDSVLQHGTRKTDVVFQYTTTAWIMWILNLFNLSCCGSMMLYDGSPFHPHPGILLEHAAKLGVTNFGTSPRYLAEIRAREIVPRKHYNLEKLRVITSTGSVLSAELYDWFYSTGFPPTAHLISMSGGTDIAGSFVGGSPLLPVYSGEIQAPALGMAISIFPASSTFPSPLPITTPNSPGELVCTKPFPSQPVCFWGSTGAEVYRKAYFERFGAGVWCQGDFIQREESGGWSILGRSDGVLNPSGVRFGSAEIYAVTETFPSISDSICVGQRRATDLDESVLLFVKLKSGHNFTENLAAKLKAAIRQKYSTRHVPKYIFEVQDIPYTVNGKKCEINVKQIVSGMHMAVGGTVANPECLGEYGRFVDLPVEGKEKGARGTKL